MPSSDAISSGAEVIIDLMYLQALITSVYTSKVDLKRVLKPGHKEQFHLSC